MWARSSRNWGGPSPALSTCDFQWWPRGAPTWFVRGENAFVTLWADGHHDDEFAHLWCASAPGVQQELVAAEPLRFFGPPYVGGRGWIGVRLDGDLDWSEIAELCQDAYRAVAPARLLAQLDG
jgi:hypothetical protein